MLVELKQQSDFLETLWKESYSNMINILLYILKKWEEKGKSIPSPKEFGFLNI